MLRERVLVEHNLASPLGPGLLLFELDSLLPLLAVTYAFIAVVAIEPAVMPLRDLLLGKVSGDKLIPSILYSRYLRR